MLVHYGFPKTLDTIKILTPAKQQIKALLAEVDTLEKRQPYGKVYLGDRHINTEMVADGAAWVYRKYNKDPPHAGTGTPGAGAGQGALGAAGGSAGCALGVAQIKTVIYFQQ